MTLIPCGVPHNVLSRFALPLSALGSVGVDEPLGEEHVSGEGALTGSRFDNRGGRVMGNPDWVGAAHAHLRVHGGRQGMLLVLALSDTGETADSRPTFSGRNVIRGGTGERSGLSGVLQFQGTVDLATGLSASDYSGEIQFHP